jgi:hypothetical protein
MTAAAAAGQPEAWHGTVLATETRHAAAVILTVATDPPMTWTPGQSVRVETALMPRERR